MKYPPRLWRLAALLLCCVLALGPLATAQEATPEVTPTPLPRPVPQTTLTVDNISADFYFSEIKQGGIGLVHVHGPDIASVRGRFFNHAITFFLNGDGWYGLLTADMDLSPRAYNLDLAVGLADGTSVALSGEVNVVAGGFIRQEFNVPADRAYLLDPELERAEFARLDSILSAYTPQALWSTEGFRLPINSEITSPFGAFRTLNQTTQTRHTGWDLRAAVGTPVVAMGAGRVAYAGRLDIRGDYVMIDHGYGIFSGYAHLSQVHVTRGQSVAAGQIIGLSGNSGRSNGPHLHWEVAVEGAWVDSVQFLATWLPAPPAGTIIGASGTTNP